MKKYSPPSLKLSSLMALSIGIIATSIIYASLSVLGIPKSISLLVSFVILIGLNLFFLFKNPQSFFSSRDRIQEGNIFERAVTRKSQVHEFVSSEKITETVTSESMKKGSLVTAEKVGLNRVSRRKDSLAVAKKNGKDRGTKERNSTITSGNLALAPEYHKPYSGHSEYWHILARPQPSPRIWSLVVLMLAELLFLLSMVALWLCAYLAMPNYVGLNGNMVAQVQISTTRKPHLINVQLTLFDKDHNSTRDINCYMMQGDRLALQGDLLTFAPWEKSIGLHEGYKLTRLVGCYNDAAFKGSNIISDLNGGEDGFFRMAQGQRWYAELVQVQANYNQSRPLLANLPVNQKTGTFNVFTSPAGLHVVQSKK